MKKKIKVLNLYAGIGGNRKLWPDNIKCTAVEINPEIARAYSDLFPNDIIIVGDAHEYLLNHYQDFDFIWSSPPCPTHGQYRYNIGVKAKGFKAVYPNMELYEEIILLKYHANCKWIVENTISYYKPLIEPQKISRHYIWANFKIKDIKIDPSNIRTKNKISDWEQELGISLSKYKISNKRQVYRNCINSFLAKHIFDQAFLKIDARQ